jgi:hypothetical protein
MVRASPNAVSLAAVQVSREMGVGVFKVGSSQWVGRE